MGSEANRKPTHSPKSPSPVLNNLIKKVKNTEHLLKTQLLDLINNTHELEMENNKLNDLLEKKDKKIKTLKKENEEMKEMVKENEELKNEVEDLKKVNKESLDKVRVYENKVSDFYVRVSVLEKLGKELTDEAEVSDKQKNGGVLGCVAEANIRQLSGEKEEPKQGTAEKFLDTIQIAADDEDDRHVPSTKRCRNSSEIEREHDSEDDKCISILIRKTGRKEIPSECNNGHADKISTGTPTIPKVLTGIQKIASHSASPFLDSDSDEENIKEGCETTFVDKKQKERRESADTRIEYESSRKQMACEKGESQERTNHKLPNIIQIDDNEDNNRSDVKDVSALKRKRGLCKVKVENDNNEERCISVLRRKPASKELQSQYMNDHVNIIRTGGKRLTSYSAERKVKVEEAYVPVKEKHTKHWETEAEMIIEFGRSFELCMNAVCALHRQNIYVGAYLLPRFNRLAERLIDWDPERKLKKTPSELNRFELDQCRMIAGTYSAELFKVYQENADRFFPPRS